jgi:hypothetical protein
MRYRICHDESPPRGRADAVDAVIISLNELSSSTEILASAKAGQKGAVLAANGTHDD